MPLECQEDARYYFECYILIQYLSKVVPRDFRITVFLSYLLTKRKTLIKKQMELLVSLLPVKAD